jgi:hypothetical protein
MEGKSRLSNFLITILVSNMLNGCVEIHDTFRSKNLVSSKGENIYINTLNWGMTDDYQYTILSKDDDMLKERKDTIGGIRGLTPFIYKFSGDTLSIYFQNGNKIDIKEEFDTIELNYYPLENRDFMELLYKAGTGKGGYHLVPDTE